MASVAEIVRVSKALSDPTRVRILVALAERELCVCELTHLLGGGQSAISRHLGILRAANLVEDVRDGKWVNYRLRSDAAPFAMEALRDPEETDLVEGAREVDRSRLGRTGGRVPC